MLEVLVLPTQYRKLIAHAYTAKPLIFYSIIVCYNEFTRFLTFRIKINALFYCQISCEDKDVFLNFQKTKPFVFSIFEKEI